MTLLDPLQGVFDAMENASITVTRSEGSRGADGWAESGTKTVLDCRGDAQQGGRRFEQMRAHHEAGDVLFFARETVSGVEVGDGATIEYDDGRTVTATVEATTLDDDSLLLSYDD